MGGSSLGSSKNVMWLQILRIHCAGLFPKSAGKRGAVTGGARVGVDGWFRSIAGTRLMEHFWGELRDGYMDDAPRYVDSVFSSTQ